MMKKNIIAILFLSSLSAPIHAQWNLVSHTDTDSGFQTRVATIENEDGFKLEIYRDANDVIRSRFNMRQSYDLLATKHCPTFQVDDREISNRSINDARCLSQARWSEYILGYITDNNVLSLPLHDLINGNVIYFRFLLRNGNYDETSFSLSGSKSVIYASLGNDLIVKINQE